MIKTLLALGGLSLGVFAAIPSGAGSSLPTASACQCQAGGDCTCGSDCKCGTKASACQCGDKCECGSSCACGK